MAALVSERFWTQSAPSLVLPFILCSSANLINDFKDDSVVWLLHFAAVCVFPADSVERAAASCRSLRADHLSAAEQSVKEQVSTKKFFIEQKKTF